MADVDAVTSGSRPASTAVHPQPTRSAVHTASRLNTSHPSHRHTASSSTNLLSLAVPPTHPMYQSLYALKSQGMMTSNHISRLVAEVDASTTPVYNSVLHELLQARSAAAQVMSGSSGSGSGGGPAMPSADLSAGAGAGGAKRDKFDRDTSMALAQARAALERVPQLRVSPATVTLTRGTKVDLTIDLNLPCAGTFSATLVVESDVSGVERFEIPVRASAAKVAFVFNDGSPLQFGRLPLGDAETRYRTATNHGSIPINFWVTGITSSGGSGGSSGGGGLSVTPMEGRIEPHTSRTFAFTFRPFDDSTQHALVTFNTDCTPAQSIRFSGAGGVPRLYLDHSERLDFGRCMIGKSDFKSLRLANIGNANLPIMVMKQHFASVSLRHLMLVFCSWSIWKRA
jgi:hypothetical protein